MLEQYEEAVFFLEHKNTQEEYQIHLKNAIVDTDDDSVEGFTAEIHYDSELQKLQAMAIIGYDFTFQDYDASGFEVLTIL
jgi:hypothetical protein